MTSTISKTQMYWNKAIETIDREELAKLQLRALQETVESALKTRFYAERLKACGIKSGQDIKSLADLSKIPYTTKDDLRSCYTDGLLAVPQEDVIRLHSSSGTTGTPTVIYHTAQDIDNWTDILARSIVATGCTKSDVFQNMMTYGLFTGGIGLHYGAERVGMTVIPISSGNTIRQLKFMKDFRTTVLHATPSYLLHIYTKFQEAGIELTELSLKKAFVGAEPHSENTRKKIEQLFKIDVYNSYGLSEMNGPGVGFECAEKKGMHIWEDNYILEVIDPLSGELLADGEEGEVVFTTLKRRATPLLRYRTKDLSSVYPSKCSCGRTHRRIARIKGRADDMLIVNGVNIYPSQIEEVIMKIPEIGTNYQICLENKGTLDRLIVKAELSPDYFTDDVREFDALKAEMVEKLKAAIIIKPAIEFHSPGSLPVSEGKAQRVFDNREKL